MSRTEVTWRFRFFPAPILYEPLTEGPVRTLAIPRILALPGAVLVLLLLTACGDGTGPDVEPASRILVYRGSGQTGVVGAALADSVVVKVTDTNNHPVEGVRIRWTADGDGIASPSASTTDDNGLTRTRWKLATTPGVQTLQASAGDLQVTFSATVRVGPPDSLTVEAGAEQNGVVSETLADTVVVRLTDPYGNPITGAAATWTAEAGSVVGDQDTDTGGRARAVWTLGGEAGVQQLRVSAAGLEGNIKATATSAAPDSLSLVSGSGQTGVVGAALADSLVVQVADAFGNPVPGVEVIWSAEGGSLDPAATTTDSVGFARTRWTLSTVPGPQIAEAAVVDATAAFEATAEVGPADSLAIAAGGAQTAEIDMPLADTVVVVVLDAYGNPVPSVEVIWSVTTGGGSVSPATTPTDSAGLSRTSWTLGGTVGTQAVEAAVAGLSVEITAEATESSCTAGMPDGDGDRLPDCAETGTGVYVSTRDAGTDPSNPDTDGDGISDGDEVRGTVQGLDLPAMGANPLRTTILMEYDWFEDSDPVNGVCTDLHSHRPTATAAAMVETMFANAPTANPDGSTGIDIIQDYGQGGLFTGGNYIEDADGYLEGGFPPNPNPNEFVGYKADHFATERDGYFHYVILSHFYTQFEGSSGLAVWKGFDMIVSLGCAVPDVHPGFDYATAHTIAHELGHNLGLTHGGTSFSDPNHKPNYNSIMNYEFQFAGIDTDCNAIGNDVPDYSTGERPTLDESALDERAGVCGLAAGVPLDWDNDAQIDSVLVSADINPWREGRPDVSGDGTISVLTDHNDWANLWFVSVSPGGAMLRMEREPVIITERRLPELKPRRDTSR